jgi:outer membrane protein OmpA-like peptidoglycan-associated protein
MRLCYIILFFLWQVPAYTQNLLVNGSFEDENICTEYQKNCAPEAWIATSLWSNYYYDQKAAEGASPGYTGTHFVGLTAGNLYKPGMRNFLRARLLCGLHRGHQYQLELYVRSPNNILDSIGFYFSPGDFLGERRSFKTIQPQLWSADGIEQPRQPSNVWQKVQLTYTATGDEGFITIGNFKRVDYRGIGRTERNNDYYFFLDDISLTPVDKHEKLCAAADSVKNDIYRESERHDYLEKKMYYMRKNPPVLVHLPVTRIVTIKKVDTLIIPDIFFNTASYELSPKSYNVLDSFGIRLAAATIDSVVMEGHTDSVGKLAYNTELSLNRALSVKAYVSGQVPGIEDKVITRGYAFVRPVASNKTPAGRQKNRRVEIFVYRRE